jgi:hypothetical protein
MAGDDMPPGAEVRTSSRFSVGGRYTKADIYRILQVPPERQRGAWDTGYREFNGDVFVFANVGIAGRTGHDYENRWVVNDRGGEDLLWQGKTSSSLRQPLVQQLLKPIGEVLVFWRADNEDPFLFAGAATAVHHEDTTPVAVTWRFDDAASPLVEEVTLIALDSQQRAPAKGQGIGISAAEARSIDRHAMAQAISYFDAEGWSVEDVSRHGPFDLYCTRGDEHLHVEVKGTKTAGDHVLLTPNEVRFAREHAATMALFIVAGIVTEHDPSGWIAGAGAIRILRPWSPSAEDLTPVGYRCALRQP